MGPASSERILICVHSSGCQVDNTGPHPFPKQPHFANLTCEMIKPSKIGLISQISNVKNRGYPGSSNRRSDTHYQPQSSVS